MSSNKKIVVLVLGVGFTLIGSLMSVMLSPPAERWAEWEHVEGQVVSSKGTRVQNTCKGVQRTYAYEEGGQRVEVKGPFVQVAFTGRDFCSEGPQEGESLVLARGTDGTVLSQVDEEQLRASGWTGAMFTGVFALIGLIMLAVGGVMFARDRGK